MISRYCGGVYPCIESSSSQIGGPYAQPQQASHINVKLAHSSIQIQLYRPPLLPFFGTGIFFAAGASADRL